MGRLKKPEIKISSLKAKGLRKRWLMNTLAVVVSLGLVGILLITAVFAGNYYASMESDMRYRAKTTAEFFSDYLIQNYSQYYQACIAYAQTFEEKDYIELQFIDVNGKLVASSYGQWMGPSPETPDIQDAISRRGIQNFVGKDPLTGEHIMAVSSPMIYSNGEVIGVLRYVTSTRKMDAQMMVVVGVSILALAVIAIVVIIVSNYYIHTILDPLQQVIEKAHMITNGSYGFQIQTKYDDEIGELADSINEMSSKINQNEKMQTEFISSLSHELRTPLTAITGWSETLLSSDNLDQGTRRGVRIIHREAARLTDMVLELLDFTRMQDGRMTLNMELSDLRNEFEDTVFMYGSRLAQDGIELDYQENDQDIPEISCDPKRLRQVFLNILDNAAKHGGEGKKIDASISYENNSVVVRIRDYGAGIPEDEIPLVKKKFYKGSSKTRGSGIGLAVCDEIVQMHGGSLILENAVGGGTLVTVQIPASQ